MSPFQGCFKELHFFYNHHTPTGLKQQIQPSNNLNCRTIEPLIRINSFETLLPTNKCSLFRFFAGNNESAVVQPVLAFREITYSG